MARFHLPKSGWGPQAVLDGDEARHLTQVLRGRVGETIVVFDGEGASATARITGLSRRTVDLSLGETRHTPPLNPALTLAQAVPKGKTMDWIVQKSVELGTARIVPLVTHHTVVQVDDGDDAGRKREKWQRVALEACKQCGQNHLPVVEEPRNFTDWLRTEPPPGELRLIASLADGAGTFRAVLRALPVRPQSVVLLVGPEGDFSPAETAAATAAGFLPVSLGEIVLRVETASMFGLSALRYEFA